LVNQPPLVANRSAGRSLAVLGSSGMLGQALCRVGQREGYRVAGLARAGAAHMVDATDAAALHAVLRSIQPDVVINAAAQTSLDACERDPGAAYAINSRVVAMLAEYCRQSAIKLVQVSTDHYFSGDANEVHDEHAPVQLLNEYARTKYAGEAFAATCPRSLILRTNLVGFRGWMSRPTFVEWAVTALTRAEPITLFNDFYTSSIDVGQFAVVLFDLLRCDAIGVLNVGAREPASKEQFILALAKRLNLGASRCNVGSVRALKGTPRAESLGLDVQRAEAVVGYRMPNLQAVIEQLALAYEEQRNAV
jgi:dTDP-4-dehydrorhamnose reductase